MNTEKIPELSSDEINQHFSEARNSERKRSPKILHNQGDYHNKVFNFVLEDSYMQPHLHPGEEKIEKMYLLSGSFALITFDDSGEVTDIYILKNGGRESIDVPAFTWHTYVMLTKEVIVFETMEGIYNPSTWKEMAAWAPSENTPDAIAYLEMLKNKVAS
ncbi:MAG: WbuC family cupin fold metalloprotein [Gammaproteobacteria bacterium]|nr:WbuC family cupin fold metalloprotein [Gammaproteobacteria bacterium]